jgi:Glycosyl hydrolase family 12
MIISSVVRTLMVRLVSVCAVLVLAAAWLISGTDASPLSITALASTSSKTVSGPSFNTICKTSQNPDVHNTTKDGSASFLPLAEGDATPNFWNVLSSAGSVRQCYSPWSGLTESIDVTSLQAGPYNGPDGYTEAGYGYNSYDGIYCSGAQSPCTVAPFPVPASSFTPQNRYLATVSYSLGAISPGQDADLTYDLWLEQVPSNAGPQPGDVEILVTPYSSFPPCGTELPSYTDSLGQTWNVYEGCGTSKKWATLHFILAARAQSRSATLTVNLSDFVDRAEALLPSNPVGSEEMTGIQLGTEFGENVCGATACSGTPDVTWNWTISQLSLSTPTANVTMIP